MHEMVQGQAGVRCVWAGAFGPFVLLCIQCRLHTMQSMNMKVAKEQMNGQRCLTKDSALTQVLVFFIPLVSSHPVHPPEQATSVFFYRLLNMISGHITHLELKLPETSK